MSTRPSAWRGRLAAALMLFSVLGSKAAMADMQAAWSPDGQRLALAVSDARQSRQWLSFWEAGRQRKSGGDLSIPADSRVTSLAFSHDGSLLAVGRTRGRDGVLLQLIAQPHGGQRLQFTLPAESGAQVLGFTADDSQVLLRGASGRVLAVDIRSGQEEQSFGLARGAALSPEGRWLALWSADALRVLELKSGSSKTLAAAGVSQLAFGQDGYLAAVAGTQVLSWSLPEGRELFRRELPGLGHDAALAYSPDRRSLAVRLGDRVYVLDRDTGGQRRIVESVEAGATVFAFDPAQRERLLVGGVRRLPQFFNIYLGGRQALILEDARYRAAAISRAGQWVAVAAASPQNESGYTRVWDLNKNSKLELPGAAASLGFVGDNLLAVDDGRGRLVIWGLPERSLKARVDAYCPRGESRLVGSAESAGLVLLRCEAGGQVVTELRNSQGELLGSWPRAGLGLSMDGGLLAFGGPQGVLIEDRRLAKQMHYQAGLNLDQLQFSADNRSFLAADAPSATLALFDVGRPSPRVILASGLRGRVSALAFSGNGTRPAVAADPGGARPPLPLRFYPVKAGSYNAQDAQLGAKDVTSGHLARVLAILPIMDGPRFVTVAEDGKALLWGEGDVLQRELL